MASRHSSFPRASVLVLGSNAVQTLLPSTLISQADALLESHRIEDVVDLAEQQSKRLHAMTSVDEHEVDELRYVYQRIGFQCLGETRFDDAGRHLFAGDLDPRALISYFPDLRGDLFGADDTVDIFAGVAEHMPPEESIYDIIVSNLVRNYSPHLPPNTREAPQTVELRNILALTAQDMLEVYLRKWRVRARSEDPSVAARTQPVKMVVDTVLAELYTASEKTPDLHALIDEPNHIVLPAIEPRGDDEKLLETWSKLIDGAWTDSTVQDPLSSMFTLLSEKRDRTLTQQWGIWLTKRDTERALKLLTSLVSGKRKSEDDRALLQQICEANSEAGAQFLEHLVLQKRSTDPDLHMRLALTYVRQLLSCIAEEATSKLWRAKASSYASGRTDASFLSYFASTTPDSEPKRVRLKTVLFLQGSTLYDPAAVREQLVEYEKILRLELAIVDGKLGQHRSALSALVHDLHDATSAETYCTLGGEIVPPRVAQSLGERYNLQPWAALLVPLATKTKPGVVPMSRLATVDDELKKRLIGILLEVYMSGGEATADRTARFLNAQAMNLDMLDVIALIPPEWPMRVLSTFLTRSLRRTLHAQHEGQIVKAVSAGENLAVAERTWLVLREQGALVEEADDDDEGVDESQGLGAEAEKGAPASFDEKVALQGYDLGEERQTPPVEIALPSPNDDSTTTSDPGSELGVGT
ncbi:hypothetical protein B0H21DRAFT_847492 [Amylocystis lapponica]|nr:hypothetical protein B0H21DRAFT_847492 [Amylocystis lapponica]